MNQKAQMSRLRMPEKMRDKLRKGAAHKSAKDYRRVSKHKLFRAIENRSPNLLKSEQILVS